ncbi:MAG: DUF2235 domain-containing protein [Myxococcota bacterium]|nr:DUF2235 domain-containing protein [Myxococcota bacterium]
MAKNIVVLSDGTAKEGGQGSSTNVYKLFNMLLDRSASQVVFYDPGLGTGRHKVTGRIGGLGISRNIKQCYEFLFENFRAGDRIYLLGFSRGATTVRSLSSLVEHFGILPRSRRELIHEAYEIYRSAEDEYDLRARANAFVERHHTMWTRVKFLGVWDTVRALGLPTFAKLNLVVDKLFQHRFHNLRLAPCVDVAIQALAIDEQRRSFTPSLWDGQVEPGQSMRQVWFAGMHSDVGGGYAEHGLSDIALEWMLRHAVDAGLELYTHHQQVIKANADGVMHDSRTGLGRLYRRRQRTWPEQRLDLPTVHQSVIDRHTNQVNDYQPWILTETEAYDVEPW